VTDIRVYGDILSESVIPLASECKSWVTISTLNVFENKETFCSSGLTLRAMAVREGSRKNEQTPKFDDLENKAMVNEG
jgi:hypothetical protein